MKCSIVVLKFRSTDKLVEFDDFIILRTMKTGNCQFPGTKISCEDIENMRVVSIPVKQRSMMLCFSLFEVSSFLFYFSFLILYLHSLA